MALQAAPNAPVIALTHAGLVEYEQALALQRKFHQEIVAGSRPNTLILLEHPSVYTAGKRTQDFEKPTDGTPVIEVDRGGRITWHGPGQLVGYPIIKLAKPTELVGFVRTLEGALIELCSEFGISAERVDGRSGVWIVDEKGSRKIAAIGIRVASGVTMHGFALNVCPDLTPFTQIVPCGIDDAAVTSMALELSREITIDEVSPVLEKYLYQALGKVSA
ncbi:MAG: lipoyl(octanoyl) transferase LipB [Actinobacteria bacterium]|uniref:lipoyl(octanoyl) transferase n=1 Tax=freshwater metagenome TaxID=449393 RepID=A0A6J7U4K8_9ZZZZ|nr:lipoyl(octanoyl) transferase LipB [Actinomycetota bacterium]